MPGNTAKTTRTVSRVPRITRKQAEKYLAGVPEETAFWSHDGQVLSDMRELKDALFNMSDQTFAYHSNEIKKDFSKWVREVIGDEKLAADLETAANREQAANMVASRLNFLIEKAA